MRLYLPHGLNSIHVFHCLYCNEYYGYTNGPVQHCQWCKDKPTLNPVNTRMMNPMFLPNYYCQNCGSIQYYFNPPTNVCPICTNSELKSIEGVSLECPTATH